MPGSWNSARPHAAKHVTIAVATMMCAAAMMLAAQATSQPRASAQAQAQTPSQPPAASASAAPMRMALTFDDLPAHGPLPIGVTRVDIAKSILDTLRRYQAPPTYGFINGKGLIQHPEDEEVLRLWRDAGHPLGNHAFSHMDLHANTVDAFERDVEANEPLLKRLMETNGQANDWHWFRYPYLREGDTREKQRAVAAFLKEHGYRVAEVTVSFNDYAYNDPYARCLAKQDTKAIDWLQENFLARAAESLDRGQASARAIAGRDVSHIMLLHVGAFHTVMLPKLLDLLRQHNVQLIALPEAAKDPIYAIDPANDPRTDWDGTLLEQLASSHHATNGATNAAPPASENVFNKLAALCR